MDESKQIQLVSFESQVARLNRPNQSVSSIAIRYDGRKSRTNRKNTLFGKRAFWLFGHIRQYASESTGGKVRPHTNKKNLTKQQNSIENTIDSFDHQCRLIIKANERQELAHTATDMPAN